MRLARILILPFAALTILILMGAFSVASLAHAESVVWNKTEVGAMCTPASTGSRICSDAEDANIENPTIAITYAVRVINPATGEVVSAGSTVPQGTVLDYEFIPHTYDHVYWFATGHFYDSPYGDWVAGAARPMGDLCVEKNYLTTLGSHGPLHATLSVDPPVKSIDVSNASCADASSGNKIAKRCTLSSVGSVPAMFTFADTKGHFFIVGGEDAAGRGSCTGQSLLPAAYSPLPIRKETSATLTGTYVLQVPRQTITHAVTIIAALENPDLHAPATPTLTSGGACVVGTPHSITFVSTDPDGDTVRYGVDWDADGSVDQFVPPSGYVPSGTSQSANRTYTTAGTKTVKVMTQDQGGLSSPWATVSFSCSQPATAQCADGVDNDGDGLMDQNDPDCSSSSDLSEFSSIPPPATPPAGLPTANLRLIVPSLIARGKTVQVTWSADNVASCNPVIGTNGDSFPHLTLGNTFYSPLGGRTSSAITERTTYTLRCVDLNGITHTKTATVNIAPNWKEK